jgi:hypothetical protein
MKIDNAMTVFKELPKTNCRECGAKTCLAFAGAVFQRQKAIGDCPHLDKVVVEKFSDGVRLPKAHRAYLDAFKKMRHEIINVDLPDAAQRLGGTFANGKLIVKVMGKDVSVDANGKLYTDIHVNGWLERTVLTAIATSKGLPVAGGWVKIHDLEGGKPWRHMFENQCVTPLHDLADDHPDLFETLMHVFSGSRVEGHMGSDIGVVLNVLPKVPILICYWKAEEGMNSDLHVFFDKTASANLGVDALYSVAVGLTQMFKKIAVRHGQPKECEA